MTSTQTRTRSIPTSYRNDGTGGRRRFTQRALSLSLHWCSSAATSSPRTAVSYAQEQWPTIGTSLISATRTDTPHGPRKTQRSTSTVYSPRFPRSQRRASTSTTPSPKARYSPRWLSERCHSSPSSSSSWLTATQLRAKARAKKASRSRRSHSSASSPASCMS